MTGLCWWWVNKESFHNLKTNVVYSNKRNVYKIENNQFFEENWSNAG